MSGTTLAVLLVALVGVAVVLAVGWPLMAGVASDEALRAEEELQASERSGELEEAIERSLAAIREIDLDHRAGHLSDEDFTALDRAERARAAELIRRRDAVAGEGDPAPR